MHRSIEITNFLKGRIKILQSRDGYRFSLDAILLANFIDEPRDSRIVDLGTGSGIIPIILAKERGFENVTGIEIQEEMARNAQQNIELNGVASSVRMIRGDFRDLAEKERELRFDAVVSNPPYRKPGTGKVNPKSERAIARHEIVCSLGELINSAVSISVKKGSLYMIYHPFRLTELVLELGRYNYHIERLCSIHPREGDPANLFLVKAVKGSNKETVIDPPIDVYGDNDEYTPYIKSIIKN